MDSWLRFSLETWWRSRDRSLKSADILLLYIMPIYYLYYLNHPNDLLPRFSSFTQLVRVTMYYLRWLHGAKLARRSSLCKTKLDNCGRKWLNVVQKHDFPEEYSTLSEGSDVATISALGAAIVFVNRWIDSCWRSIGLFFNGLCWEVSSCFGQGSSIFPYWCVRRTF